MAAGVKPNLLEKTFKFMGENPNGAMFVAVAIAAFKGVFRPIFTMTDKKTDPQTKKYTAIREALTELIAIPVYIAVPLIGGAIVKKRLAGSTAIEKKAAEANVKFLAVLASTAIIPAICNIIQPPIMDSIKRKGETKKRSLKIIQFQHQQILTNLLSKDLAQFQEEHVLTIMV